MKSPEQAGIPSKHKQRGSIGLDDAITMPGLMLSVAIGMGGFFDHILTGEGKWRSDEEKAIVSDLIYLANNINSCKRIEAYGSVEDKIANIQGCKDNRREYEKRYLGNRYTNMVEKEEERMNSDKKIMILGAVCALGWISLIRGDSSCGG